MRARMEQFEHILAHDLPALFEELSLDDAARAALLRHAGDLKDWMSGILEWHRRCARYTPGELRRSRAFLPDGFGMSAMAVR